MTAGFIVKQGPTGEKNTSSFPKIIEKTKHYTTAYSNIEEY